jgi:hypothetical protein
MIKRMYEYPSKLKVGDKIVIKDLEENRTFLETITQESLPSGDKVFVYTEHQMLTCDSGSKVDIRRSA